MGWSEVRDGSPRFGLFPNRAPNGASCCSRSCGTGMDSRESSNTIGAWAQREFEDLLKHGRAVVVAALVLVIAISWLNLVAGAGTGMSVFEMSSLSVAMGLPLIDPMGQAMVAM